MEFKEFNLQPQLLEAISYMGFETPTPIQQQSIPEIMANRDLIACAQTGTGKTAAFVLPVLSKLTLQKQTHINTLIIVPTRELAIQLDQQIQGLSYFIPVHSKAVYGGGDGSDWDTERKALTGDTAIIVATPGKLIAHLSMGYVKFDKIEHLILDEADKMLDMGFLPDIQRIVSFVPVKRQTLMFSATMPTKIRELARQILIDPVEINIAMSKPPEGVLQAAYIVYDHQKTSLINSLIGNKTSYESILIFTSKKSKVNDIVKVMRSKSYLVEGISSDLDQNERNEVLSRFKAKKTRVLVATDVISRGIDIKDINLVINYDVPGDAEDYVHRVGRTARANNTGIAITLINEKEMSKFRRIEELIGQEIIKLPLKTELGKGPVLTTTPHHSNKSIKHKKYKHFKHNWRKTR